MRNRRIRDIIGPQKLAVVKPDETVREGARKMVASNVAAMLVVDAGGKLVGIFTERDMLRRVVAEGRDPDRTEVAKVMTARPHVVSPDTTGVEAMRIMQELRVRHLPVAADGRALGIVSIRDFLGAEADEVRREQKNRERLWEA
jgi:CBS domain-containing protein